MTKQAYKPQVGMSPSWGLFRNSAASGPLNSPTKWSGLVEAWMFNEGAGAAAFSCTNTHSGSFVSAPTWAPGRFGGPAITFASGSYVNFGVARPADTQGSVVAWIRPTSFTIDNTILCSYINDNNILVFNTNITTGAPYVQRFSTIGSINDYIFGGTSMAVNTWNHVVWTSTGSAYAIYLNGVLQTLTVGAGSNSGRWFSGLATGSIRVGAASVALAYEFTGQIDHVRIYAHALKQSEVLALYQEPFGDFHKNVLWQQSGAASVATLKTYDGLLNASIKTFHGLAHNSAKTVTTLIP